MSRQGARNFPACHPQFRLLWASINNRCYNPDCAGWKSYGAKGIKNHLTPYDLEFLWNRDRADDMERPSIDRIDPRKDYCLDNCRFLELQENCRRGRPIKHSPAIVIRVSSHLKQQMKEMAEKSFRTVPNLALHLMKVGLKHYDLEKDH